MKLIFLLVAFSLLHCASASVFWQNVCVDSACSDGCVETELPQGVCVRTSNGGSAENYCEYGALLQRVYMFQPNCTDYHVDQEVELDTCFHGEINYVEYACPNQARQQLLLLRNPSEPVVQVGLLAVNVASTVQALPEAAIDRLNEALSMKLKFVQSGTPSLAEAKVRQVHHQLEVTWNGTSAMIETLSKHIGSPSSWKLVGAHGHETLTESFSYRRMGDLHADQLHRVFHVGTVQDGKALVLRVDSVALQATSDQLHAFAVLLGADGREIVSFVW